MLKRVLIANRGEIAVRIIRACRNLGIGSVAVYSKEDAKALHGKLADRRVCIGEGAVSNSYLHMESIITAAKNTDCDAVHPGYGFLSENPAFVRLCEENGLVFIGPPAGVIEQMGNKSNARARMRAAGVPVVPGSREALYSAEEALPIAREIGFPVMIKASAGGGGRGMRECFDEEDFVSLFDTAQRESANAFGDDAMYLERLIVHPRHVEVQIMADSFGNVVSLGERDCSLQRNHQKLIEEAPSPAVDAETARKMGEYAVLAAKSVGYVGAGTVEFIVSPEGEFYFMEMNTRIQVEHGVTELVTGIDLVEEQLRVASKLPLSFTQEDVRVRGHAIECRINAEIPEQNFMPSPGTVTRLHLPGGNGVRVDTALYTGYMVPSTYDSMIAKLLVHGPTREAAIARLRAALDETVIAGIDTNLSFQYRLTDTDAFRSGKTDTGFVEWFVSGGSRGEGE